jgi:serine/threonine-protein kinase
MGVVYKARQARPQRIVALKMILAGQFAGQSDIERFHREAEAAAQLDHPGIVPVYEVGQRDGQHYFSMAFVEGRSLAERLADGPLPAKEAAALVARIAEAVHYAHERNVIHRDLKPGNILLDADGHPRVTDFGLAKRIEGGADLTATGQIIGTPNYMPPEQAAGKSDEIYRTADVYALGGILYALLTGRPPFQAATPVETIMQVLEEPPVRPRVLNRRLPRDLETITLKCLQKPKRLRYQTAAELAADLERFSRGEPIKARQTSTAARVVRWALRHRAKSAAIFAAAIAAVALLAGLFMWLVDQSQWKAKTVAYSVGAENGRLAVRCDGLTFVFANVPATQLDSASGKLRTDGYVFTSGATIAIEVSDGAVQRSTQRHGIPGVIAFAVTDQGDTQPGSPDYTLYLSNNGSTWSTRARSGEVQPLLVAVSPPGPLKTVTIGPDGAVETLVYGR